MVDPLLMEQVKRLDVAGRLELIGELWQSLDHDELEVTHADNALIDERLDDMKRHPDASASWDDVAARLRARLP
ncbi:addiction module protein [Microcella sp.]|uniref:addiction module protein n=1 Tax=Microcella sp. TaxID=1913979 RepID=UPI00255F2860|nr:addiction module protein [Microcella sp.]MBX9470653.1 addiction module protein [Microcella sp.]